VVVLLHEDDALEIFCEAGGFNYMLSRIRKSNSGPPTLEDRKIAALMLEQVGLNKTANRKIMADLVVKWRDLPLWTSLFNRFGSKYLLETGIDELFRGWKEFTFQKVE